MYSLPVMDRLGMVRSLAEQVVLSTPSPYPASFDGSTLRFGAALASLMSISIVGLMLLYWMGREMWHGRRDAFPTEPLFAIRGIFFSAALSAVLRSAPEAAMMITWRESASAAAAILTVKRWCDAAAIVPAMTWMGLVFVFYPAICTSLVRMAREDKFASAFKLRPKISRERALKLAVTLALIIAISTLIAVGKRW